MDTLENRLQKRIHVSLYALIFLVTLLGLSVLLESCTDSCEVTNKYTYWEPVYTSLNELRASVEVTEPQPVKTPGKIYFKNNFLFINEPGKGIHLIDNKDPEHPVFKSFLSIPGNFELAIKGNTLYADSFIDLVAFDISDLSNIHETGRLENIFSNYNSLGFYVDPVKGLVTDWKISDVSTTIETSECDVNVQTWGGIYYEGGVAFASDVSFNKSAAIAPGHGSGPGVGGSMARFTISKDHLYTLDRGNLQTVDISGGKLMAGAQTFVAWDIETIFPYNDNLFLGASGGLHIMDISNPAAPVKVSTYEHVRSCDPVVVDDQYAYVTLRSGTQCQGFTNQLEVIDIQDLTAPTLLKTYPMHNPHGLGKDESTLFLCDGDQGLKVFDASDINTIDQNLLAHYNDIHAFDVIPFNQVLMMIGEDGLYQYDYSDPKDIKFLSHIAVTHEN